MDALECDKDNATEAQSTTGCPRNEHSPGTTLGTNQYTKSGCRLFTMMRLQKSPPQAPPSWNPNAVSTLECGGSTSTQQHRHLPQKPKQIHSKQSTSFSSSPAPAKHFSGTMHPRDSQLKRLSSTPYATETLNMAKTNGDPNQPLLPRLRQNNQGTSQGPTPRHTFDKTGSIRL
jgi:hypothetical protein